MKKIITVACLLFFNLILSQNLFEGELTYSHNMKMGSIDFSKSRKYFDTLKIIYKNKDYIKIKNKRNFEKVIFIDSLRKTYFIYSEQTKKSKKFFINEDNLNFGRLYDRKNSHFGKVISFVKSDTIINLKESELSLSKLVLKRKYGIETYVYSETDSLKLSDNRNIIRNMGEQIYPNEIVSVIDNSILYYYKLSANKTDVLVEYKLIDIQYKVVEDDVFKLPKHKDEKGFKKENKKDNRFKFYRVID